MTGWKTIILVALLPDGTLAQGGKALEIARSARSAVEESTAERPAKRRLRARHRGEHHIVFVDKGKADVVEEGNSFAVVRSATHPRARPPARSSTRRCPREQAGGLLVVDALEHASTARSLRDPYVGDRVEMHSAASRWVGRRASASRSERR